MSTEEQAFDFMAAAEETGRQLDEMVKRIPKELKALLAEEWCKSPWLAELPKAAEKADVATNKLEEAIVFLARTVRNAGLIVCLASVIIPLVTWGIAYWNVIDIRQEVATFESEVQTLGEAVTLLRNESGDGVILQNYGGEERGVVIPEGYVYTHVGNNTAGRRVWCINRNQPQTENNALLR